MELWILVAIYVLVGATIAGVSLGSKGRDFDNNVSIPKLGLFLVFWPLILFIMVLAKLCQKNPYRNG